MSASKQLTAFSEATKIKLQFYVYAYYDPATMSTSGIPFYIGKGQGDRVFAHLKEAEDARNQGVSLEGKAKLQQIVDILLRNESPIIKIVRHGLKREEDALAVEAALIDCLRPYLSNKQSGHHSDELGLMDAEFLNRQYSGALQKADFSTLDVDAVLVNLNRTFEDRLKKGDNLDTLFSPVELYDATRMAWRMDNAVSTQGDHPVRYAFAVYGSRIMEVYRIAAWLPAGSTLRHDGTPITLPEGHKRMEFVGSIADETLRNFIGCTLPEGYAWGKGQANPIKYIRKGGAVETPELSSDAQEDSVNDIA